MNSKKIFVIATLFLLLSLILVPEFAMAWSIGEPIVPQSCGVGTPIDCCNDNPPCDNPSCSCGITEFFIMLSNVYSFIVWEIATPLAIIALTIGGIIMMMSAGNPNLLGMGKKIFYSAVIGLVLVFCSYLIINFIVATLAGCPDSGLPICNWSSLSI